MERTFEITAYTGAYRQQILLIWERSVLATHHFVTQTDFNEIKKQVHAIDFSRFDVYCLVTGDLAAGFTGVAHKKIEMLFLDPADIGQGLGRRLLNFAVSQLGADTLNVNEQNERAVRFYRTSGFEVYERTDTDDAGRPYPLLRMKLKKELRTMPACTAFEHFLSQ